MIMNSFVQLKIVYFWIIIMKNYKFFAKFVAAINICCGIVKICIMCLIKVKLLHSLMLSIILICEINHLKGLNILKLNKIVGT